MSHYTNSNFKGISVNFRVYEVSNEQDAPAEIKKVEEETGLPATDALRFGADKLMDALIAHFAS